MEATVNIAHIGIRIRCLLTRSTQRVSTRVQILAVLRVAEEADVGLVVFLRAGTARLEDIDVRGGLPPICSHIQVGVDWKSETRFDEQEDAIAAEVGQPHGGRFDSFCQGDTGVMAERDQDGVDQTESEEGLRQEAEVARAMKREEGQQHVVDVVSHK